MTTSSTTSWPATISTTWRNKHDKTPRLCYTIRRGFDPFRGNPKPDFYFLSPAFLFCRKSIFGVFILDRVSLVWYNNSRPADILSLEKQVKNNKSQQVEPVQEIRVPFAGLCSFCSGMRDELTLFFCFFFAIGVDKGDRLWYTNNRSGGKLQPVIHWTWIPFRVRDTRFFLLER